MGYGFVYGDPKAGLIIVEGFIIIWEGRLPPDGMAVGPTRRTCACNKGGWASAPNTTGSKTNQ
jgi:hypothetical protein